MPTANAPRQSVKQDPASLDLAKFARVVALLGSTHEGERSNAVTLGGRMLQAAGMRWEEFVDGHRRAEIATEAAAVLLAENTALKAELDQLRRTGTVALWNDVGAQVSNTRVAAEWALALRDGGQVWLSYWETGFLGTCTKWIGPLTPKMQSKFHRIMDRIVAQTGLTPP